MQMKQFSFYVITLATGFMMAFIVMCVFAVSAQAQLEIPTEVPVTPPKNRATQPAPIPTEEIPKATPVQNRIQQEVRLAEGILFVRIPAGEFLMGSPNSEPARAKDESPVSRAVIAKSFWMSKYEVTQGEWTAVMGNNPSQYRYGDEHPVENISWEDCQRFIQRLNAVSPRTFRLPTETEWEYACRAGSRTAYCSGNSVSDLDRCGWYDGNSGTGHHPVGEKEPNYWGLYDMHGNVYEWCQDYYWENYGNHPGDASAWEHPNENANRVRRGGSFQQPAKNCRSAFRGTGLPENQREDVGLRLVMQE